MFTDGEWGSSGNIHNAALFHDLLLRFVVHCMLFSTVSSGILLIGLCKHILLHLNFYIVHVIKCTYTYTLCIYADIMSCMKNIT